jgi:tetratricopeptide (TPR) repeat protein
VAINQHTSINLLAAQHLKVSSCAVLLALTVPMHNVCARETADPDRFNHAKKTMVTATKFSRHFDDESVSDGLSGLNESTSGKTTAPVSSKPVVHSHAPQVAHGKTLKKIGPGGGGSGRNVWTPGGALADPPSSAVLAQAIVRVRPLVESGKYAEAQQIMTEYERSHARCHCFRNQLAKIAVAHAEQQMSISPVTAATAAREALVADPLYKPAQSVLSQALGSMGMDANDANVRLKLGDQLLAQGKNTEAAAEYAESLRLKPSAEAHTGIANAAWRNHSKDLAKIEYERAVAVNPKHSAALRELGTLSYKQGDIVGASGHLSKALIANPEDKEAGNQLIALWQEQVSIHQDANSHLGLARAYQLSGQLKPAEDEYHKVVQLDPTNPKLPQARRSFKVAMVHDRAMQSMYSAQDLEKRGMIQQAQQRSAAAVAMYPNCRSILLYHGQLSQRMGNYADARNSYQAVLKQDPTNAIASAGLNALPAGAPNAYSSFVPATGGLSSAAGGAADAGAFSSAAGGAAAANSGSMWQNAAGAGSAIAGGAPTPGSMVFGAPGSGAFGGTYGGANGGAMPGYGPAGYGDMQSMDSTKISTDGQVNMMSNFIGGLTSIINPGMLTAPGSPIPGAISGVLTGGASPQAMTAVDASGATSALAQAAAALKAAGAQPSAGQPSGGVLSAASSASVPYAANPPAYGSINAVNGVVNSPGYGSATNFGVVNSPGYGSATNFGAANPSGYGSATNFGAVNPSGYGSAAANFGAVNPSGYGSSATNFGAVNASGYGSPTNFGAANSGAGNFSAAAAALAGGATGGSSQMLMSLANQAIANGASPADLIRLGEKYGPLLQNKSPEQIAKIYKKHKGALEKELGVKMPDRIGPMTPARSQLATTAKTPADMLLYAPGGGGVSGVTTNNTTNNFATANNFATTNSVTTSNNFNTANHSTLNGVGAASGFSGAGTAPQSASGLSHNSTGAPQNNGIPSFEQIMNGQNSSPTNPSSTVP